MCLNGVNRKLRGWKTYRKSRREVLQHTNCFQLGEGVAKCFGELQGRT